MDTDTLKRQEIGRLDNTNNSDYLVDFIKIENTPFTIVKENDNYFGVMGKYRLTEPYGDKVQLEKELKKITWDRLLVVIGIMIKEQEKLNF